MKTKCFLFTLTVLSAFFAVSTPAQAATVYHITDLGAGVYFSNLDETGCVWTNVFVEFGEGTNGSPPHPSPQPTLAYMYVTQWDWCQGQYLIYAQTNPPATLPEGAAQVATNLKSASLNARVELVDIDTGSPVTTADVSLNWTATKESPTRSNNHTHFQSPAGIANVHTRSVSQSADASGSVLVEGVNVTPSPGEGCIESQMDGLVQIYRKP
jgi:hypothetical protein